MAYIDSNLNDPAKYFTTFLWTGDGTSPRSLTGVGFQANMMWSKIRDVGHEHSIVDDVRGVDNKRLKTDTNAAEDTTNTHGHFDSLDSDGFTVTGASGYYNVNRNTEPYVGWFWKESATAGFDIVSYTGNATAGNTVSHSLSAVPKMIITKGRASTNNWSVYHEATGNGKAILLNLDYAPQDYTSFWNDTTPSSSVFTLGDGSDTNPSGTMIAYLWSEKQGFSKFGSFEGNNNADGAFVYLGFRPAWLMIKSSGTGGSNYDWVIFDNKRNTFNVSDNTLDANNNGAEVASGRNEVDFLSNGFKCRSSYADVNSSTTYIYMAFAESPFVNSNGVPNNAR